MFKSKKKVMSEEEIREFSEKISKEVLEKQMETLEERAKAFSDADGKIDPVARMAMTIKECNQFTTEYVTQMLVKILGDQ